MGAFEDLLKRQGYVKLDQYGLVRTPDDRILSTRPAVLDDGLGGKIVGWADGDLAAAELGHWGAAAKPAAAKRVAPRVVPSAPPLPPAPPRVARGTTPPVVAAEPVVEEDEWEWEIAMARARAVADDPMTSCGTLAVVKTAVRANTPPGVPFAASRSTVIPVPQLPVAARGSDVRPFNPGAPPPRLATQQRNAARAAALTEDTVVTGAVPANEDHTSPYVTLPMEVKATGYAHTKRVAAKHR